jgi:CheY-like chemotaxis protein
VSAPDTPRHNKRFSTHSKTNRCIETFRGWTLKVDHQLELSRLLDREVGGLCASEDLVHVGGGATEVGFIQDGPRRPDVVVTDPTMPGLPAVDLIQNLRSNPRTQASDVVRAAVGHPPRALPRPARRPLHRVQHRETGRRRLCLLRGLPRHGARPLCPTSEAWPQALPRVPVVSGRQTVTCTVSDDDLAFVVGELSGLEPRITGPNAWRVVTHEQNHRQARGRRQPHPIHLTVEDYDARPAQVKARRHRLAEPR